MAATEGERVIEVLEGLEQHVLIEVGKVAGVETSFSSSAAAFNIGEATLEECAMQQRQVWMMPLRGRASRFCQNRVEPNRQILGRARRADYCTSEVGVLSGHALDGTAAERARSRGDRPIVAEVASVKQERTGKQRRLRDDASDRLTAKYMRHYTDAHRREVRTRPRNGLPNETRQCILTALSLQLYVAPSPLSLKGCCRRGPRETTQEPTTIAAMTAAPAFE